MSGWETLAQLSDFEDEGVSEVLVSGAVESLHHFAHYDLNVLVGGHAIEEI